MGLNVLAGFAMESFLERFVDCLTADTDYAST
jgi:hypothetical protein